MVWFGKRTGKIGLVLVLDLALIGLAPGVPLAPAAAATGNLFAFDSSPGAHVGRGLSAEETENISIVPNSTASRIEINAYAFSEPYRIEVRAPTGALLAPGVYAGVSSGAPQSEWSFRFSGAGNGCASTSSLEIHEIVLDGAGPPTGIALSFIHECGLADGRAPTFGRVRVGTTAPLSGPGVIRGSRHYPGPFHIGEPSEAIHHSIVALGDEAVTIHGVFVEASNPSDFLLGNDQCSGVTLLPSETCTFDVTFRPAGPGFRSAALRVVHDAGPVDWQFRLTGVAWIPTTTTSWVEGSWSPNIPITEHYIRLWMQLDPMVDFGDVYCEMDGEPVWRRGTKVGGLFYCDAPRTPGTHLFTGEWSGSSTHLPSAAAPLSVSVQTEMRLDLTVSKEIAFPAQPITVAATVTPADGLMSEGGLLQIVESTSGDELDAIVVDPGSRTLRIDWMPPSSGRFVLEARYAGIPGVFDPAAKQIAISVVPFADVGELDPFSREIGWLYHAGITGGCSADRFCPGSYVTRGQMAAFLDRALRLAPTAINPFRDDDGHPFEAAINRLAAAGITGGCSANRFCPGAYVTRGEMAAFIDRALRLAPTTINPFRDDDGHPFEAAINRLAAAGITGGCSADRFCPGAYVTRGQMAAFLYRALRNR